MGLRWLEGDTPFLSGHHLQLVGPWDLRGTPRNLVLFEALHRRMDYIYLLVTEASETWPCPSLSGFRRPPWIYGHQGKGSENTGQWGQLVAWLMPSVAGETHLPRVGLGKQSQRPEHEEPHSETLQEALLWAVWEEEAGRSTAFSPLAFTVTKRWDVETTSPFSLLPHSTPQQQRGWQPPRLELLTHVSGPKQHWRHTSQGRGRVDRTSSGSKT